MISSIDDMERAVLQCGLLPFFSNDIPGFSVEEKAAPGMLFGGNEYAGCWEWKGPVILRQTAAYGKFFRRKAGFVALDLLPDFLNYRRNRYPVKPDSTEAMILDIIRSNEGMTSAELRKTVFPTGKRRSPDSLPDISARGAACGRHSLEGPLQRLQMGGHLLIADFEYKLTSRGERYGWGTALYSTPEIWFGHDLKAAGDAPEESLARLVASLAGRLPHASRAALEKLLR